LNTITMGWWGAITSNVDWCERNYVVTHYIAEFYNSVSSIPMILMGIFGMLWVLQLGTKFQTRFIITYFFLLVVGVGSVMFHMTLQYEYQLLDELPMILGSLAFLYSILDIPLPEYNTDGTPLQKIRNPTAGWVLIARASAITIYGLATIFLMATYVDSPLPMFVSYAAMLVFIAVRSILLFAYTQDPIIKQWFLAALVAYLSAGVCWLSEKNFCDPLRPYSEYLHMVWHLLAGFATYAYVTLICYITAKDHDLSPKMKVIAGHLPYVSLPFKQN